MGPELGRFLHSRVSALRPVADPCASVDGASFGDRTPVYTIWSLGNHKATEPEGSLPLRFIAYVYIYISDLYMVYTIWCIEYVT